MYDISNIQLGMIFECPDPLGTCTFTCEVIKLNIGEIYGSTRLKIIASENPEDKNFRICLEFTEPSFINHWNRGEYILLSNPNYIKARSRLANLF